MEGTKKKFKSNYGDSNGPDDACRGKDVLGMKGKGCCRRVSKREIQTRGDRVLEEREVKETFSKFEGVTSANQYN